MIEGNIKCFFHSADLDGHCSGAIVKYYNPGCETVGINYGAPFPWGHISSDDIIFMVDYTLQPFDLMHKLQLHCSSLIWIDHHKTAVEQALEGGFNPPGIRKIGSGACELTWRYFSNTKIPTAIKLLSEYDVWDHSDPRTLPFQYGFRMIGDTYPENQTMWQSFFTGDSMIQEIMDVGDIIIDYEKKQNYKFCKAYTFPTKLGDYNCIACNRGFTNSQIFDSVWDETVYDLMITFIRLPPPARRWTVSLYSTRGDIDCGEIAKGFGGGGHKGAAGFQCESLPFEI